MTCLIFYFSILSIAVISSEVEKDMKDENLLFSNSKNVFFIAEQRFKTYYAIILRSKKLVEVVGFEPTQHEALVLQTSSTLLL